MAELQRQVGVSFACLPDLLPKHRTPPDGGVFRADLSVIGTESRTICFGSFGVSGNRTPPRFLGGPIP